MSQELRFEWNISKAEKNIKKHRVSFEEAATIFDDPMFITFIDQEHSIDEERYITIGLSNSARLLMIAHTDRNGLIRIISARKATKKEQLFYEKFD
ncbi:MAG TPA: BrnT family toxin [Caldilineae bacterium]|nr:BrnT family toxin [Caldilineae bacterium]